MQWFQLLLDIFGYILFKYIILIFCYKAGRLSDFNNYVMSDNANPMIATDKELCWAYVGAVANGATVELTCLSVLSGRLIYFIIIYSSLYSEQFHVHDLYLRWTLCSFSFLFIRYTHDFVYIDHLYIDFPVAHWSSKSLLNAKNI